MLSLQTVLVNEVYMQLMKQLCEISLHHKFKTEDGCESLQIMVLNRPLAACFSSPVHKVQVSSYSQCMWTFFFRCLLNYCCHSVFNLPITKRRMKNFPHHFFLLCVLNYILHAYTKFKITKYTLRKGLYCCFMTIIMIMNVW